MTQQNKFDILQERERIMRKIDYIRRHASRMCLESNNIPIDIVVTTLQRLKRRRDELNKLLGTQSAVLDKFTKIINGEYNAR